MSDLVISQQQQLVPVFLGQIGGITAHVCDARALHIFLENQRQFADWIKQRIEHYGFEENQDFILISQKSEIKKGRGGDRRSKDYHLTLDMAKELSMVENNSKGRQARRYFIEMEKKALGSANTPISLLQPAEEFKAAYSVAQLLFTGNQATLSANKAVRRVTGVDMLEYFGATHLLADSQEALLTATELAERTGVPSRQINRLLERHGLQSGHRDHKNRLRWELTQRGKQYGTYLDTGKKHGDGTPVRQIKWREKLAVDLKGILETANVERWIQ